MPDSCCAIGCSNRRTAESKLEFYKIPSESKPEKRRLWLKAISCSNWSEGQIKNAKLCSVHFINGKKSNDCTSPSYVPSIFFFKKKSDAYQHQVTSRWLRQKNRAETSDQKKSKQKENINIIQTYETDRNADLLDVVDFHVEDRILPCQITHKGNSNRENTKSSKILAYKLKNYSLSKSRTHFGFINLKKSEKKFMFFTGISISVFQFILSEIHVKQLTKILSNEDHLLIVLTKLKMGFYNKDIAYRFDIKPEIVSKIYRSWLPKLAEFLVDFIIWPSKEALRTNLPKCFKNYQKTTCIIDCTEIFIQRPFNLQARAQTWSNYKHHNTIKYFIAVAPHGAISYISNGWGGRVSDKQLTNDCGFLDYIETGDIILADRGFTIEKELAVRGAVLQTPSFANKKLQLSANEVDHSRKLSNVRIHVERVIGRMRKFDILNKTIPISQVDMLDEVMVVIAGLVNLNIGIV